jgi:hypothetical protein
VDKRLIVIFALFIVSLGIVIAAEAGPPSATVTMTLDHNRMTIELELLRSDGTWRSTRAWVDSGGTDVIVS